EVKIFVLEASNPTKNPAGLSRVLRDLRGKNGFTTEGAEAVEVKIFVLEASNPTKNPAGLSRVLRDLRGKKRIHHRGR
ncbi:MAG: hypothetical protein KGM47_04500, partial [Acidobacteriota bacterium]|nr:hypothetical protein [Acidobacteriota bacterium]